MENNNWIIAIAVIAVVAIVAVFGMVTMTGYAMAKINVEKGYTSHLSLCTGLANTEYEKCMEQTKGQDENILPILVEECGTNFQKAIFACKMQYSSGSNGGGQCFSGTGCTTQECCTGYTGVGCLLAACDGLNEYYCQPDCAIVIDR